ncbi:MAG TPA: nitrate ABC transporter permease, partial [Methylophaga sp.]|nr:nitrate ABC transporter permease [Methylophaga sp.]
IVTMVVSAVYISADPMFSKSFITSAITVMLCSLWPTLINTAVGVSSIDRDLLNVGKVLRLGYFTTVWKIVIPSSIPMIFTGLRISLGIGWMVLIAAEMLAQNPGLGKFVWDEFQNGSSNSLSRIMVAVLAIGLIGFVLDRIMLTLQKFFSYDKTANIR